MDINLQLKEIILKKSINHKEKILEEKNLKSAHIYCILNNLSSQSYGCLLEFYISKKYEMKKINNNGDLSKNNINFEIKTSLGGSNFNKFNFVQIRLNQNCDYILTAYNLSIENLTDNGELFIFKINKENMKKLILKYGSYSHGTISLLGKIDTDNINNNREYSLRPKYNSILWKELLLFRIKETDI